jgi:hypothetical protein
MIPFTVMVSMYSATAHRKCRSQRNQAVQAFFFDPFVRAFGGGVAFGARSEISTARVSQRCLT